MNNTLRWGLVSTANINNALIDPIKKSSRSELIAVASRDKSKADAYAKEKGIGKAFGSYDELLAWDGIDAVYIPLPNSLHCEWACKALEAGKYVLCEKPMVLTLQEFDAIEEARSKSSADIFEAFMYLHHPQMRKIREAMDKGMIGNPLFIQSCFCINIGPERSDNIRLRPEVGGGSLWDVGVYPVSFSVYLGGEKAPAEVYADGYLGETKVDIGFQGQLRFNGGFSSQIACGFRQPETRLVSVFGDEGRIDCDEPWQPGWRGNPSRISIRSTKGTEEQIEIPEKDPYLCEVEAMEDIVLDGKEPFLPLSLSREFLKTILALYRSAEEKRAVSTNSI